MVKILKDLRFTIIAAAIAVALILIAYLTDIDLVKINLTLLKGIKTHQVDNILSGFALIFVGSALDYACRRKRHKVEIEAQKLRTLRATMRMAQDIVNNF